MVAYGWSFIRNYSGKRCYAVSLPTMEPELPDSTFNAVIDFENILTLGTVQSLDTLVFTNPSPEASLSINGTNVIIIVMQNGICFKTALGAVGLFNIDYRDLNILNAETNLVHLKNLKNNNHLLVDFTNETYQLFYTGTIADETLFNAAALLDAPTNLINSGGKIGQQPKMLARITASKADGSALYGTVQNLFLAGSGLNPSIQGFDTLGNVYVPINDFMVRA